LDGEQWWRFSDDTVYAIQEEQAHQGNVFMLFYERLDEPTSPQVPEADAASEMIPVTCNAPLPPESIPGGSLADNEAAAAVPLPDDGDEIFDLIPPKLAVAEHSATSEMKESTPVTAIAHSTAPHEVIQGTPTGAIVQDTETDMSEAESEDTPSTQLASDFEVEHISPPTSKPFIHMPPHLMRTAGNAAVREQETRQSLPMVSAT
jgi:ubiquitin carboxyl-terminal hydrolase 1